MIVNVRGGLGNQIFQVSYALKKNNDISLNSSSARIRDVFFDLNNTSICHCPILSFLSGGFRFFVNRLFKPSFDFDLFNVLDGYFQSNFNNDNLHPQLVRAIVDRIDTDLFGEYSKTLVIHIRGGDYLVGRARKIYESVASSYYNNAFEFLIKYHSMDFNRIVVVSNDKEHSIEIINSFSFGDSVNVEFLNGTEWEDFSVLVAAKYAIIPNSTFSFAARLVSNTYGFKTVVPNCWYKSGSGLNPPSSNQFFSI